MAESLLKASIAPEYTGPPAPCLFDRAPVRRGLQRGRGAWDGFAEAPGGAESGAIPGYTESLPNMRRDA
ncbi:hypothetical protein D3C81_2027560 [compost metagenome]